MVTRRMLALPAVWLLAGAACVMVFALRAGADPEAGDPMLRLALHRHGEAQQVLWETRKRHLEPAVLRDVERQDAVRSGMIGVEWSPLTTTAGTLDAKRATTAPGWVPLFRRWYRELDLQPGDRVAISSSASFPALFYAARLAAESLGLETQSVISLTASNYGANLPGFDYWAMEEALRRRDVLPPSVLGVTPGGHGDAGLDLEAEAREALRLRIEAIAERRDGPAVIWPGSLDESREFRRRLLLEQAPPDVYVSIGGHVTGYGTGARVLSVPRGLVRPDTLSSGALPESVLGDALRLGIPVLNVLDIRGIMADEGLAPGSEAPLEPLSPARRALALAGVLFLVVAIVRLGRPQPPPIPDEENVA